MQDLSNGNTLSAWGMMAAGTRSGNGGASLYDTNTAHELYIVISPLI